MLSEKLISIAIENGATKAAVIPQSAIVTSTSFRDICRGNACGSYGRNWTCPPDIGDIDELIEKVRKYPFGLLYQTITEIEDSLDLEGMAEAGLNHVKASQKIEAALKSILGDHFHLSCPCRLCEVCAKRTDEPCRHPDLAMPSLESCGIDVYNTTKDTELKYINGQNTVTYFGIVLFSEE